MITRKEFDSSVDGRRKAFFGRIIIGWCIIGIIGFLTIFVYFVNRGRDAVLNYVELAFYLYTLPYIVAITLPLIIIVFRARILDKVKNESNSGGFLYTWVAGLVFALVFFVEGWTITSAVMKIFLLF